MTGRPAGTRGRLRWAGWALAGALGGLAALPAVALPSFDEVKAAHRPSDRTLLDRHGTPLQTLRVDASVRRLPWVVIADLSPALLQAIVLSEDRRFWQHSGVDWPAVARSAWANALNTRTQGASTLTMQLAGLVDDGLARPAGGRGLVQKIDQAVTATHLETQWSKHQILEAYLNAVPFRGELVGINALSQTLFGKHPGGLDALEAAIAAALLRAPNAAPERVAERACGVLKLQQLDCSGVSGLAATALLRRGGMPLGEQLAPHLARRLLRGDGPPQLRSTLDAPLQRLALAALRQQLAELAGRNVEDGAIVVLDNASGEVRAWVGSSGSFSDAPAVDGVLARRQPGSTLKPFVYGLAFEQRLITPASLLDDSPAQINTAAGLYLPQNYDRRFRGWVSARTALGASLNVPAVRVAALLGPDALVQRLNDFGLALPEPGGFYGHALALGGADVTLLALTNAYRALANGGRWSPVVGLGAGLGGPDGAAATAPPPRRVADAAAVHLVSHILADNNARAGTFGLDSALATRGFAAVKTGTSKDLRDNWCVGFTDRYTVGVWVGNASGAAMHAVSGTSGAAPVWRALMQALHAERPSRPPLAPPGVETLAIRFDGAQEPPRSERFLAGTGQTLQRAGTEAGPVAGAVRAYGITSPRDGSVFALDPDIPPIAQRIRFEGEAGHWWLDGRPIGRGTQVSWAPWPGPHRLELRGSGGQPLQVVRFEVRGASVKRVALAPGPATR
jgi:penicillin-binding protein 1C